MTQRVLVTGAVFGIGLEIVRALSVENVLAGLAKAAGTSIDEARASMLAVQSLKRFVDPKDIAWLCVFLASDAGTSISGHVIAIDNDAHQASS